MEKELAGKTALVTGASRGIGRAIAIKLASLGAHVIVNYTSNEDAARETLSGITALGSTGEIIRFDVSNSAGTASAIREILSARGAIHILVNNAGITRDALLARMRPEDWDRVVSTNLTGAFVCTQAVLMTMLKQRWGRIVNIGSVVGAMGNPGQAAYAATKAGLEGFTKSVAREVASRGITANVVSPGFIETDMTAVLPEKVREQLLAQIPAGRMGKAEEVAGTVAFLVSESAAYITGHVLHVNGGLLCT